MDGLLLDSEREFMEALVKIGQPIGFSRAELEAFFKTLVGTSVEVTGARLAEFLANEVDAGEFEHQWRNANAMCRSAAIPLRPTVRDVLPRLAQAGYRMAVVTSTKRAPALKHLKHAGLLGYFELVVGGDEVSANKPDPAPYLQAARGLGVDVSRCAAFEDSDLGTRAAVSAGCTTTQIPDLRPPVPLPQIGQHVASTLRRAVENLGLIAAGVD